MIRYRAFISYSHEDEATAAWLHQAVERYKVPKVVTKETGVTRVVPIFRDREGLGAASDLSSELIDALSHSESLIVLCSPASQKSSWVDQEITTFRQERPGGEVFAVVVDGEGEPRQLFPDALSMAGHEPLAADIREEGDGRRDGVTKLVAGLLGISFERLKRREERRKLRSLMAVAAVSLLGMAVTTGMAIYAWQAQQEANRHAQISDNVSAFMMQLFRSAKPRDRDPESISVLEVLRQGEAQVVDIEDPAVRATLMYTIADAYITLIEHERAESLLDESLEILSELYGEHDVRLYEPLIKLSRVKEDSGELQAANQYAERLSMVSAGFADKQPLLHAKALANHARVLSNLGRYEESEAKHLAALKVKSKLEPSREVALSSTLSNLAVTNHRLGRYQQALEYFQRSLEDELKYVDETNVRVGMTYHNMAISQRELGDIPGATRSFEKALKIKIDVLGQDHPSVAFTLNGLGSIKGMAGEHEQAVKLFIESAEVKSAALGEDHPSVANSFTNAADSLVQLGRLDDASTFANKALNIRLVKLGADHDLVAVSKLSLGEIAHRQNRIDEARQQFIDAIGIFTKKFGEEHKFTVDAKAKLASIDQEE